MTITRIGVRSVYKVTKQDMFSLQYGFEYMWNDEVVLKLADILSQIRRKHK